MKRWLILTTLAVIAVAGYLAWRCWPTAWGPRPISELDRVHYFADSDSRLEFHLGPVAKDGGWVGLPEPTSAVPFQSTADPHRMGFIRPQVCGECHPDVLKGFLQTAHYRTSSMASRDTVLGSFDPGADRLATRDSSLHFEMLEKDDGLYQRVVVERGGRTYQHDARFDLVIGSGNHGQSYLYFQGNELFELPVSYFTETGGWINSPGFQYKDGAADFARRIHDRCMDCHNTYFAKAPGSENRYDLTKFILGVTCVRCHGPAWAHVQFHEHNKDATEPHHILNPASLTRQRADEVCAQCHSGAGEPILPPLSYLPGEPLERYMSLDMSGESAENRDPHAANQLARLRKSKCYQNNNELTCYTCHNPHRNERGEMKTFSQRCLKCHQHSDCGAAAELGAQIDDRCVSCHMPSRRDAAGAMQTADGMLLPLLRDHYIRARTEIGDALMEQLRSNNPESPDDSKPSRSDARD